MDGTSKRLTVWATSVDRISNVPQRLFSSTDRKIIQDIFMLSKRYTGENLREFVSGIVMEKQDGRDIGVIRQEEQHFTVDEDDLVSTFDKWKERVENAEQYESESLSVTYDTNDTVGRFATHVLALCHNKSLFETEDGRLGVRPAHVKEGDSICVIHGLRTPFVIRNYTSHPIVHHFWILVGNCYVKEHMDSSWEPTSDSEQITFV